MSLTNTINKYAHLIPEKCVVCDDGTKGLPFCSTCGAFNVVAISNIKAPIKVSTKHKNPLHLIDNSAGNSDNGLSHVDILALRYKLSEEFSDTPLEVATEEEFDKRIVPLLQTGAIDDKFFDLWVSYWKKIQSLIVDCHSRVNDIKEGSINTLTAWDFGDVNLCFSQMLRDELDKSTRELLLNSESVLPILRYAEFAEKCISNLIWLQMGCIALRLCININQLSEMIKVLSTELRNDSDLKVMVRRATTLTVDEAKARLACSIERVPYTGKTELCHYALRAITECKVNLNNLISGLSNVTPIDTCTISSAEERLLSLQQELGELAKKHTISSVDVEAWICIKKYGFYTLSGAGVPINADKIALIPTMSVTDISEYMTSAIQNFTDSLDGLYAHADKYSEWEDQIQAAMDDEDERLEMEEQIQARRDEEERARRQLTTLLRNVQEQFLTRQVALRQKAEGRFFLSAFTEAFGADAGTSWEGLTRK